MSILSDYYKVIVEEGLSKSEEGLRLYLDFLFSDISFEGRSVLDIGGGSGMFSFYAATRGASKTVCLEPEAAGGSAGMNDQFARIGHKLNLPNVSLVSQTFQEFPAEPESFDIILLHNSVNHLDEKACIHLLKDQNAQVTYKQLFRMLAQIASDGADLIISDCSPKNLFPLLGLKHPISRSIEWHKHQTPEVWAKLLHEAGFDAPNVHWSSYERLGKLGWKLFSNKPAAFFLSGHFRLHMQKRM